MAKKKATRTLPARRTAPRRVTREQRDTDIKKRLDRISPDGALFQIFVEQRDRRSDLLADTTLYWWNLGKWFHKVNKEYREEGVLELAGALGIPRTEVNRSMRLVTLYPALKDLKELLAFRGPSGRPVMWAQLRLLISEDIDDAERSALIGKCVTEEWTIEELSARLQSELGARPGRGGGRPIAIPKTLGQGLAKWSSQNAVWIKFGNEVFGSDAGIADLIGRTPAERITPAMLDQAAALDAQLEAMIAIAERERASVRTIREHVAAVIGGRAPEDNGDDDAAPATAALPPAATPVAPPKVVAAAPPTAPPAPAPAAGGAAARAAGLPAPAAKKRRMVD